MPYLLLVPLLLFGLTAMAPVHPAAGEGERPVSQCQMIARALPSATFASLTGAAALPAQARADDLGRHPARPSDAAALPAQARADEEVRITFIGHSTFFIETPAGVSIATDYNGWYRTPTLPTVVTMNKAHSSHYTMHPDAGIAHVLHGWDEASAKGADHDLVVEDVYIRNVPTDIRSWGGAMEANGNSIFIFEVAGLCIGHLGHLHHELTDTQYAEIGRLDILMVPVDGGLTMGADSMSRVVQRLRSSLILPMHRTGPPVERFLAMFGGDFEVVRDGAATLSVSLRSLPKQPTIHVLAGM